MATSSTSSTSSAASAVTTSNIDVASIVQQLMTVENQPLDKLKTKIAGVQTQISDLGTMKSKVVALQTALAAFEDPSTYNNPTASSSDSTVVTATASSNAAIGSVNVSVTQLASATQLTLQGTKTSSLSPTYAGGTPSTDSYDLSNVTLGAGATLQIGGLTYTAGSQGATGAQIISDLTAYAGNPASTLANGSLTGGATITANWTISSPNSTTLLLTSKDALVATTDLGAATVSLTNFTSSNDVVPIDPVKGFSINVGGAVYNTLTSLNPLAHTGQSGATTLTDLKNWINGLGVNVQANIVQTVSGNDYVLQINGTQTGSSNAISIDQGSSSVTVNSISTAQDAVASIGGVSVKRSSNTINDVINGITFNLTGISKNSSVAAVTVQQGVDNSSAMINTLIKAYNDVINQYNTFTANANSGTGSSTTIGDFATNPTMLSYVNDIKAMFAFGATDTTSASISGYKSASESAQIDTQNGYLQINNVKYSFAKIGNSNPTVTDLITWVNGLGAGVTASFDGSKIQINNSRSGGTNGIDFSGFSNSVNVTRKTISLASMGMDLQLDGTIQFNTASYQQAVTGGLYSKLANGLKLGFSGGGASLGSFLKSEVDPTTGAINQQILDQKNSVTDLQKRQADLQDHLNQVQNNYITQYSALNALLFQLNSTSTSLANALLAVTNINAGK